MLFFSDKSPNTLLRSFFKAIAISQQWIKIDQVGRYYPYIHTYQHTHSLMQLQAEAQLSMHNMTLVYAAVSSIS